MRTSSTLATRTVTRTATAAAALVAAVGLGVPQAHAAGTGWTVSGGGPVSATATDFQMKDTTTSAPWTDCTSSSFTGDAPDGTALSGTPAVTLTSAAPTACTGPLALTWTITPSGLPWEFEADSYNAATGTTSGTLTGVEAGLDGTLCSGSFGGPGGTGPATLAASYTDSSHTLTISGGNLHAYGVRGCLNVINDGDAITLTASYVVNPATLKITSP